MTGIIPILVAIIAAAVLLIVLMSVTSLKSKDGKAGKPGRGRNRNVIIKECTKKLSHDPHNVSALTPLADLYFSEQDYEKAYPLYETLYELRRVHVELNNKQISLRYGICAEKTAKFEEAERALSEAARAAPNDFNAIFNLGNVFYNRKDYERAIMCLKKAVILNPDSSDVSKPLGFSLFHAKKYRESLSYLRKVLDDEPENKEALFYIATAMEEAGYNEKAMKVFMHLRPDPVFGAQSCIAAGSMHEKQNQFDKAIQDYEIALKLENVPPETKITIYYKLANTYISQHNVAKGLYYLKQIQAINPNYRDVASLVQRYQELNQNRNLQAYLMSGTSDFVALCRKFVSGYYTDAFVKIEDISVAAESIEILCSVETAKWEDTEFFRFFRSTGSIGELYVRDFHSKLRDVKCDRGFCVSAGSFTEEAHKYVEGRPIDLIEKNKLVTILKKIDILN